MAVMVCWKRREGDHLRDRCAQNLVGSNHHLLEDNSMMRTFAYPVSRV